MINRNEVYACKIHSRQLKMGDKKYQNIKETIQINLNNFRCNEKDIKEEYYMRSKEGRYLTKKLRIDMVDMELGRKICYTASETILSKWCKLFTTEDIEEIKRLGEELMNKESNEKLVEEIREFTKQISGIANNINQIARIANSRYSVSHDDYSYISKELSNFILNFEKILYSRQN